MGFLAPAFLAGIVAVGLPLYLHLLRRNTSTPLPFSSLMLFELRQQNTTRRRRLRYWLLLALRLAVVLLLVLAFAEPYVDRFVVGAAPDKLQWSWSTILSACGRELVLPMLSVLLALFFRREASGIERRLWRWARRSIS